MAGRRGWYEGKKARRLVDAETMAAILYNFATNAEYRDAVHTEFSRVQSLFGEYQSALEKAYPKPEVKVPE